MGATEQKHSSKVSKAQSAQWWKPRTTSQQPLGWARLPPAQPGSKGQRVPLRTVADVQAAAPLDVVKNVLPKELAVQVLQELLAEAPKWIRGTWFMFGKEHLAPRTSCFFSLTSPDMVDEYRANGGQLDIAEDVTTSRPSAALLQAAQLVDQAVSEASGRVAESLAPDDRDGWKCSYTLANMYKDGEERVGPHSDRLTQLGPRAIIASLSLGATRTFRMIMQKPKAGEAATGNSLPLRANPLSITKDAGGASCGTVEAACDTLAVGDAEASSRREVTSVDLELMHNTLVIMWPPTQEEWKHEVPSRKNVPEHPVAGTMRINLTFRKLKPYWAERAPSCRCTPKRQAVLKAAQGRGTGAQQRYYYTCDNTSGGACGFWQWEQS